VAYWWDSSRIAGNLEVIFVMESCGCAVTQAQSAFVAGSHTRARISAAMWARGTGRRFTGGIEGGRDVVIQPATILRVTQCSGVIGQYR
jgi:hypothetical protein